MTFEDLSRAWQEERAEEEGASSAGVRELSTTRARAVRLMDGLAFRGFVVGAVTAVIFWRFVSVTLETAVYPVLVVVGSGMWMGWGAVLAFRLWSVRSPKIDPTVPVRDAIEVEVHRLKRADRDSREHGGMLGLLFGGGQFLSYVGFGGLQEDLWYTILVAFFLGGIVALAYRNRNWFADHRIRPLLDDLEEWLVELGAEGNVT